MPKTKAQREQKFASKIQDLDLEQRDIEYTEDFFSHALPRQTEHNMARLKKAATPEEKFTLSKSFVDSDIDEQWLENQVSYDGQLAVDVFETDDAIVLVTAVAGVRNDDLDIAMNGDMVTIKGSREHHHHDLTDDQYLIRECYWGGFSRSIILPVDIQHEHVSAVIENGVLTITLPKSQRSHNTKIEVKEIS